MLTTAQVEQVLTRAPGLKIGVLGDLFLDRYLDLDAALTEPSIETGLDAYQVVRVRSYPGAAGTIINNLVALGIGRIVPVAVIGDDGEGYGLRQALAALPPVDASGVLSSGDRRTPTYTKPMFCAAGEPPRELNRIDIKNRMPTPPAVEDAIIARLRERWPACDAWLVLDQVSETDCGVVTARVRNEVARLASKAPPFVLADSRERIGEFRSVAVKPNLNECLRALGVSDAAGPTEWRTHLRRLADRLGRPVFCTRGEHGVLVAEPAAEEVIGASAYPVRGPIDPVGAGDSASAGIATAVAAGLSYAPAAAFGNLVASITVQQIGTTGTASPEQVRARCRECLS